MLRGIDRPLLRKPGIKSGCWLPRDWGLVGRHPLMNVDAVCNCTQMSKRLNSLVIKYVFGDFALLILYFVPQERYSEAPKTITSYDVQLAFRASILHYVSLFLP